MISAFSSYLPNIQNDAFIHDSAVIIGNVEIGRRSSIWPHSVLRGDMGEIRIGSYTSIQDGTIAHVTEGVSSTIVGDKVTVGHRVILHGCIVENECLIGMGSILLDNCVVGKGSFIAAGCLITSETVIPAGSLVMGSPGKVIRQVGERERQIIERSWQTYDRYRHLMIQAESPGH